MASEESEDLQRDIYILSGVFGGVSLILLISMIVLIVLFTKLKRRIKDVSITLETCTQGIQDPQRILPRLVPEQQQQQYFGMTPGRFENNNAPIQEPYSIYPRKGGYD